MVTESSPQIELPFIHRPTNPAGERFSFFVLCGFFTVAVVVMGIVAYASLARQGHWFHLAVPTLMLVGWWLAMRAIAANYRRTAAWWRIDFDHVERTIGTASTVVEFEDVSCLRVRPNSAVLVSARRPTLVLPKPAAQALAHSDLIDTMLRSIDRIIHSEGAWSVRARPWLGALQVAGGLALVGVSFTSFFHLGHIGQAVKMINDGRRFFSRGLVVTRTGIKTSLHDFATIRWAEIKAAETGTGGLTIETLGGQKLHVSPYADNYVPLVTYVTRMLSEPGEEFGNELWPEFSE